MEYMGPVALPPGKNHSPFVMSKGKLLVVFNSFGPRHRAKAAVLQAYDPNVVFLEIAGAWLIFFHAPYFGDISLYYACLFSIY